MYGCFHPKKVTNRYTSEQLWTPCGKCDYCANVRKYELSSRIDREFLNPINKSCYLITLDYHNEGLPIYVLNREKGYFASNREGFPTLNAEDVPLYPQPVNHPVSGCFGHLCYPDVLAFFQTIRINLRNALTRRNSEFINQHFSNITHEDARFRYFLCGEYGPTTFRPHYHILVWFKQRWTDAQFGYISQIIRKAWALGSVDIQACVSDGASNYVAGYVTSPAGLPTVLTNKPLKPFCTFSKMPVIGSYQITYSEVRQILTDGAHQRTEWDETSRTHVPAKLSPSFFSRFFPKCVGFSTRTAYEQLRVYSYVFNYFKDKGITHSLAEAEELTIGKIDYPILMYTESQRYEIYCSMKEDLRRKKCFAMYGNTDLEAHPDIEVSLSMDDVPTCKEWDYRDKYASLVCYRYCIALGWSPEAVLSGIQKVYSRIKSDALGKFYETQEDYNTNYVQLNA